MTKRIFLGIIISSLVVVIPVLGNIEVFHAPQIWIIFIFGVLASVLQPSYNPFTITTKPKDRGTGAQIIWSVYITQLVAILESAYLRYPKSVEWDMVAVIALGCMVVGLALRTWSIIILGNLFTMHIAIHKDHSITQRGPYKIVRHPSYLGAFILYFSTTIFLHAWYSSLATILILPLAFLRRIHYEEEMLITEFGEDYASYSSRVKKIIPWIW